MSFKELVEDSLSRCDQDLKQDLYKSIVICGGNSMLKGFKFIIIYKRHYNILEILKKRIIIMLFKNDLIKRKIKII